jgi:hypothetical protein
LAIVAKRRDAVTVKFVDFEALNFRSRPVFPRLDSPGCPDMEILG